MTDRLDDRIHGLMQQVIDETPLPPMLPDEPIDVSRTSAPGWVVGLATAVIVLIVVGAMSLVFGGSEGSVPPAESDAIGGVHLHEMGVYFDLGSYMVFAPGAEHEPVMDVYTPEDGGPYPIVVVYHGDPEIHTNESTDELARRIAETGAVVFNPTYGGVGKTARDLVLIQDQGNCALSYAADVGPSYGGDPEDVRLVGVGIGANTAFMAQRLPTAVSRECGVDLTYSRVTQIIGLDGDYTLSPEWNDSLPEHPGAGFFHWYDEVTPWDMLQWKSAYPLPTYELIVDTKNVSTYSDVETYLDLRHVVGENRGQTYTDFDVRTSWEGLGVIAADEITPRQVSEMMHAYLVELEYPVTYTAVTGNGTGLGPQASEAIVSKIRDRWDTEAQVLAVVDEFTKAWNRYDTEAIRRLVPDNFEHRYGDHGFLYDLESFLATFDETYTARHFRADLGLDRSIQPDGDDFLIEEVGTLRWEWRTPTGSMTDYTEQKGIMTYRLIETDNGWRIGNAHWIEDSFVFWDRNLSNRR